MREKQEWMAFVCLVLAFGVLTASVTAVLLEKSCSRRSFEAVGAVCQEILTEDPKTEQAVMAALKKILFQSDGRFGGRQAPGIWL